MCLFEIFERDAVFEQNKKIVPIVSIVSIVFNPTQASGVFGLPQALFLKTIETILGAKNVLL